MLWALPEGPVCARPHSGNHELNHIAAGAHVLCYHHAASNLTTIAWRHTWQRNGIPRPARQLPVTGTPKSVGGRTTSTRAPMPGRVGTSTITRAGTATA